jgi:hypothetical protein
MQCLLSGAPALLGEHPDPDPDPDPDPCKNAANARPNSNSPHPDGVGAPAEGPGPGARAAAEPLREAGGKAGPERVDNKGGSEGKEMQRAARAAGAFADAPCGLSACAVRVSCERGIV